MHSFFLKRRRLVQGLLTAAIAGPSLPARAQALGARAGNLSIIVPNPPGAGLDALARMLALLLTEGSENRPVVENAPGGNGVIAGQRLLNAARVDDTVLLSTPGLETVVQALSPQLLTFDPEKDLRTVAIVGVQRYLLVAETTDLDVRALLRRTGTAAGGSEPLRFGTSGASGLTSLVGTALQRSFARPMDLIPYQGMANVSRALLAREVQLAVVDEMSARLLVASGRVQPVAALATEPALLFPDVPLVKDVGLPPIHMDNWFALYASARMSDARARELAARIEALGKTPAFREGMQRLGMLPLVRTGAALETYERRELLRLREFIAKHR